MLTFKGQNGQMIRYSDCNAPSPDDRVWCYNPDCPGGRVIVDFFAFWKNPGGVVEGQSCDTRISTCQEHQAGFEQAKEAFGANQGSGAYLTKEEVNSL